MREIIYNDQLYAVHDTLETLAFQECKLDNGQTDTNTIYKENSKWYGDKIEPVQASRMCYNKDKKFAAHKHILRPRAHDFTQECFIVIKGGIEIKILTPENELIDCIIATAGDIVILYRGYHSLFVLQDNSVFYEVKNSGPFTEPKDDKVYL